VSAKLCSIDQRAPPIFGRVAITSGIGPHSSLLSFSVLLSWKSSQSVKSRCTQILYNCPNLSKHGTCLKMCRVVYSDTGMTWMELFVYDVGSLHSKSWRWINTRLIVVMVTASAWFTSTVNLALVLFDTDLPQLSRQTQGSQVTSPFFVTPVTAETDHQDSFHRPRLPLPAPSIWNSLNSYIVFKSRLKTFIFCQTFKPV